MSDTVGTVTAILVLFSIRLFLSDLGLDQFQRTLFQLGPVIGLRISGEDIALSLRQGTII